MNNRERTRAILHYEKYDRMPVVHFGYWDELLDKWLAEGHITKEERMGYADGNAIDMQMNERLGFDFCYSPQVGSSVGLFPPFEQKVMERFEDGSYIYQNSTGLIERAKEGISSIPMTVDTKLKDREAWEKEYLPRLQKSKDRVNAEWIKEIAAKQEKFDVPLGLHVGSY